MKKEIKIKKRMDKIYLGISWFISISLFIAIFLSFYEKNWINLFVSILALFLVTLPKLFQKRFNVRLPLEFQTAIVIFIYASVFLGEVLKFYHRFWWWDSLLHCLSGLALGFIGFLIIYILNKKGKFKANPLWIVIFSFSFAIALGTVWEIFEFAMDSVFALDMQRARYSIEIIKAYGSSRIVILDSMRDLIIDSIGALIASIMSYIYLIKGDVPIYTRLIRKFEEGNPGLFEK